MEPVKTVKPRLVLVLGGPGAGKGTQSTNIARQFDFVHLSAGGLLRRERENFASNNARIIAGHMKNGTTVPDEITRELIEREMRNAQMNKFIISGYPRDKDNFLGLKEKMEVEVLFVIHLDCPENVCMNHCLQRVVEGRGRTDDNEDNIRKRIEIFNKETTPILDYYKGIGIVKTFDANQTTEDVFINIKQAIFKLI